MRDNDSRLITEAWQKSYEEGRLEGEDEIPGHDDDAEVYDELRGLHEADKKEAVAAEVKARFNIDVEWHGNPGDPGGGEWHRTDVHFLADNKSRVVTDDELEKIMIIEDPERALERWPSLRKHPELFNSAFSDDKAAEEEIFPPENGRRY